MSVQVGVLKEIIYNLLPAVAAVVVFVIIIIIFISIVIIIIIIIILLLLLFSSKFCLFKGIVKTEHRDELANVLTRVLLAKMLRRKVRWLF